MIQSLLPCVFLNNFIQGRGRQLKGKTTSIPEELTTNILPCTGICMYSQEKQTNKRKKRATVYLFDHLSPKAEPLCKNMPANHMKKSEDIRNAIMAL